MCTLRRCRGSHVLLPSFHSLTAPGLWVCFQNQSFTLAYFLKIDLQDKPFCDCARPVLSTQSAFYLVSGQFVRCEPASGEKVWLLPYHRPKFAFCYCPFRQTAVNRSGRHVENRISSTITLQRRRRALVRGGRSHRMAYFTGLF